MLANNILILGLAAIASAQSFVGFAAGGITCETGVSATQDEVVAAMVGPKGTLTEKRADNLATRGCNKVKAPLFKVSFVRTLASTPIYVFFSFSLRLLPSVLCCRVCFGMFGRLNPHCFC